MAMPADPILQHPRDWTLQEVLALPEDEGQRIELLDGALLVSPAPRYEHQHMQHKIAFALELALPAGYDVAPGVNVVLNSERLLIPDVAVTTVPGHKGVYCKGADLLLAVEIISPSSRTTDRVLKRQLYAEAGVPFFLVGDPTGDPVSAICYELAGGAYREIAHAENGTLVLTRPFDVTVRLG